ncbi:MAG TPA: TlyA family RNA methyltransferase [Intrasporangium sp.]|uniref:TlyA family RNA methyltransferase n=1 Tax=Intrasporangium sp. TaxID=1925024 RepID=UPI002D77B72B|nr:TlyA family RNA methyltransferase [Intrasporangium sp.]HET7397795.1 TlyA family RNA methyltransferase [Intrasporangium sp.]
MTTRRLDAELVRRGLARSRAQARELVAAGTVLVDGRPVSKPAQPVGNDTPLGLSEMPDPWVGRGALKLLHAFELWGHPADAGGRRLDPRGRRCLDVGASTGGFTQVLLEHGARHVTALDVGRGQLVPQLASDSRVRDLPGTNIRDVRPGDLGAPFELVVGDLSFISLLLTLGPMAALLAPGGDLVVLVKPQFEVGRERLGRGGVVRSAAERRRVVRLVAEHASSLGLQVLGLAPSPVPGSEGNREFLLWLRASPAAVMSSLDDMLEAIDREEAQ